MKVSACGYLSKGKRKEDGSTGIIVSSYSCECEAPRRSELGYVVKLHAFASPKDRRASRQPYGKTPSHSASRETIHISEGELANGIVLSSAWEGSASDNRPRHLCQSCWNTTSACVANGSMEGKNHWREYVVMKSFVCPTGMCIGHTAAVCRGELPSRV